MPFMVVALEVSHVLMFPLKELVNKYWKLAMPLVHVVSALSSLISKNCLLVYVTPSISPVSPSAASVHRTVTPLLALRKFS